MSVMTAERAKTGYALAHDEGEAFWLLGMLQTVKIGRADTDGRFGLLEIVVKPGDGSPWHVHPEEDEWFYVLDGQFTFYVGDTRMDLGAGGSARSGAGSPTSRRNPANCIGAKPTSARAGLSPAPMKVWGTPFGPYANPPAPRSIRVSPT